MLNKPRFSKYYPLKLEEEAVFLLSERGSVELRNPVHKLLAPLIDGHREAREIVEEAFLHLVSESATAEDFIGAGVKAHYSLVQMEQQGYIVEVDSDSPPPFVAFCDYLNIAPGEARRLLERTKVSIKMIGVSENMAEELTAILESLNIRVGEEGDIEVVLTDDYLQESLEEYNRKALENNRTWMLVKPGGTIAWIGPIFQPRHTPCWHCLSHRLMDNLPLENYLRRKDNRKKSPLGVTAFLNSSIHTVLNMVATEIFKWIAQKGNKELEGNLLTYDVLKSRIDAHSIIERPQCPSCGLRRGGGSQGLQAPVLGKRKKVFGVDGGYRSLPPSQTWQKYRHLIDPLTGIIRLLEKVSPDYSPLLHTYVARHNCELTDIQSLRINISGRSAGKGKTDISARVSALGEAIERYSAVFQGDEIRLRSNCRNLGEQAIHPHACLNFSQKQYQNRQDWQKKCPSPSQRVPLPFDEERERDWTPVWSLTEKAFKYLPTAYCYSGYPQEADTSECPGDSNGRAAGNCTEEAILQGFMELVERDAVALWWYNRTKHTGVALSSFDEPYFRDLEEYYRTLGRELWVLDITSDLNIPTFAAISRRTDSETEDILLGYGAHFDATIAIGRALTEVNQILPAVLSSNPDGTTIYKSYEPLAIEWWQTAAVKDHPYLRPDGNRPLKTAKDYGKIENTDLLEDVHLCQKIVEERGMEMLILDQTRPDIGMKVVKVIVPGLRHFWRRLGPGRLYEVPVKLGLLDSPLEEEQLNPFPMWM